MERYALCSIGDGGGEGGVAVRRGGVGGGDMHAVGLTSHNERHLCTAQVPLCR